MSTNISTSKLIKSAIFTALWIFLSEFFFMPTFALSVTSGVYCNIIVYCACIAWILRDRYDDTLNLPAKIFVGIAVAGGVVLLLIGTFGTWAMLGNSDEYRNLIGKIEKTEFTANIQPINANQMMIVDEQIARRIGEKELGSDPGLGSRTEVGDFHLQAIKGKLYWIAPLEHSGFFRWWAFSEEGTPGYIRVSATNQEDYSLVKTNGKGEPINIRYQTGGWFGEDLGRHIYTNGYRSQWFTQYIFEIDDDGNPFWTVTLLDTKVGLGGDDAYGVLVVDPRTGEIQKYSIDKAPAWIDRIQPESVVRSQVDDWGNYIHGVWSNLSDKDVIRAADESSLVLGRDGRSYFYFGLKSSGNENSTVGFVMVDTRTKKAHWFQQSGATEDAAKKSATGKVSEKGYQASDGVTYNIDGHPTYEFLLKDEAELMKLVALVNVHDHGIVGIGENRMEAIQDYRNQLANRGNAVSITTSDMNKSVVESIVSRFSSEIIKGNTVYRFILQNNPSLIFNAGPTVSNELSLTRAGDSVRISFIELNGVGTVSIETFDNLQILTQSDTLQVQNELNIDSVRQNRTDKMSNQVVDEKFNNLTPKEKKDLLKKAGK